jgi:hypothetical protein
MEKGPGFFDENAEVENKPAGYGSMSNNRAAQIGIFEDLKTSKGTNNFRSSLPANSNVANHENLSASAMPLSLDDFLTDTEKEVHEDPEKRKLNNERIDREKKNSNEKKEDEYNSDNHLRIKILEEKFQELSNSFVTFEEQVSKGVFQLKTYLIVRYSRILYSRTNKKNDV